jgi:tetraspanin-13/31
MTSNQVSSLPIIGGVIACGVFLLVVSIGGIYATLKHHQVGLFFYMVVLFVLFIIQFSIACACLAVSKETSDSLATQGWSTVNFDAKARVQETFSCCGFKEELRGNTNASDSMGHPSCMKIVRLGVVRRRIRGNDVNI